MKPDVRAVAGGLPSDEDIVNTGRPGAAPGYDGGGSAGLRLARAAPPGGLPRAGRRSRDRAPTAVLDDLRWGARGGHVASDVRGGRGRRADPGGDRAVPGVQPGAQRADPGAGRRAVGEGPERE